MKSLAAVLAFLIARGLAGTDNYENARYAEKSLCAKQPQPEWCK